MRAQDWRERLATAFVIGLALGLVLLLHYGVTPGLPPAAAAARRRTLLASRTTLIVLLRVAILMWLPFKIDVVSCSSGGGAPPGGGVAAALASVTALARGAFDLLVPVSWLHVLFGAALGLQLPPLEHAALHAASLARLMSRAPAGAPLAWFRWELIALEGPPCT